MDRSSFTDVLIFRAARDIKRRWKPALWVFSGLILITLLVALFLPSKYNSHLKILVKNERANSIINAGGQTQGILYLNDVSESRINTEIELLTSRDLLRSVVDRCHLERFVSSRVKDPDRRREMAVQNLSKSLVVTSEHRSSVIGVVYSSADPYLSAQVLQALTDLYLNSHLELHGAPGTYEFFDKMWKGASEQLNRADQDLAEFSATRQIASLNDEKTLLSQRLADLRNRQAESSASAQKSHQEASSYKSSISNLSTSVEKERRSIPNQMAVEQLSTLLVTLQNKRAEAVTRYQPQDRIITELDSQISTTRSAIDDAKKTPAQEVASGVNPTFQSAEDNLVRANAAYSGNMAEAASFAVRIRADEQRLADMSAITASYDELVRNRDELVRLRDTYSKSRDEAFISKSLDKQKFSNIAVVENPMPETIAAEPRRALILVIGLIWAMLAGVVTAMLMELRAFRIYSAFELEQTIPVPVLAAIPQNVIYIAEEHLELYLAMQRTIFLSAPQGGAL